MGWLDWLEGVAGPNFAPAALWTLLALVALVVVFIVIRVVRSMTFGTFVAGGRNRKTRLAVMDATPVDSQRRLVLVRRDDVEHLLLIGGPSDVVVERDIRLHGPVRRPPGPPEQTAAPLEAQQRPRPVEAPQQRRPVQATRTEPRPQAPPPAPIAAAPARPAPARPADPGMQPPRGNAPAPAAASAPPPAPRLKPIESEKSLISDLDFDDIGKRKPKTPEISLEDEMNRLLGELSNTKR